MRERTQFLMTHLQISAIDRHYEKWTGQSGINYDCSSCFTPNFTRHYFLEEKMHSNFLFVSANSLVLLMRSCVNIISQIAILTIPIATQLFISKS